MIDILAGVKLGGRIVAADYFFDSSYFTHIVSKSSSIVFFFSVVHTMWLSIGC